MHTKKVFTARIGIFLLSATLLMAQGACPPPPRWIYPGQTLSGKIDVLGAQDEYNFRASTGDAVYVEVARTSGNFEAGVALFAPDGSPVGDGACSTSGTANLYADHLPMDGTYTLIVLDCHSDANTSGEYCISITII